MNCDCPTKSLDLGPVHVFALKNTSTATFIALTTAFAGQEVDAVRARMTLEALTANLSVQLAYQTSSDLTTWSTTAIGTARTANGATHESDANLADALFYRFGVLVKNVPSAEQCESALVSLQLDLARS